jgi:RNA polymerase II elongation factor ELL
MTATMLPSAGVALVGAPTGDLGDRPPPVQAMQVDMTQDIVDELLESMRSGKPPQILFGRTPVGVPMFFGACRAPVQAC